MTEVSTQPVCPGWGHSEKTQLGELVAGAGQPPSAVLRGERGSSWYSVFAGGPQMQPLHHSRRLGHCTQRSSRCWV